MDFSNPSPPPYNEIIADLDDAIIEASKKAIQEAQENKRKNNHIIFMNAIEIGDADTVKALSNQFITNVLVYAAMRSHVLGHKHVVKVLITELMRINPVSKYTNWTNKEVEYVNKFMNHF